jgi:hypothetical protein
MGCREQNQQRAEKQHDEFIQEAEETRGRLHLENPTAALSPTRRAGGNSHATANRWQGGLRIDG